MIVTRDLVVGHHRPVLTLPDLQLVSGKLVALVGPNGVGKTTILSTLAGRLAPLSGVVLADDVRVHALDARGRARRLAYLPAEDPTAEPMLVEEAVMQGRLAHRPWTLAPPGRADEDAVQDAVSVMGLRGFMARSTDELSSGERQRVWVAMALAQQSPTLLLDEPTSHLDVRSAADLLQTLRRVAERGRCVVVVLHDLNVAAAFAHLVALIAPGRVLAFGPPADVLTPSLLSTAYGAPMRVVRDADGGFLIAPALQVQEVAS